MSLIDESAVASANLAGLRQLSQDATIPFTSYTRYVLPLDGYIFWLKTETLSVFGSLHVTINKEQREDETIAINRVVLTTGTEIQPFNAIDPDQLWIGEYNGQKFAFSYGGPRYKVAGLYHYNGNAVYPALESQLVDTGYQLPMDTLVVSNSLPAWLTLSTYSPVWLVPANPAITLYPSFAVPDNLRPPYGTVHIEPAQTRGLQSAPLLGPTRPVGSAALGTVSGYALSATHWQLTTDHVRVTLYGLTNQQALDFQDLVLRYSYDQDVIGIMNVPVMRDEKRTQAEIGVLAMKKSIDFDISYYQNRINDVARSLIESVTVNFIPTV